MKKILFAVFLLQVLTYGRDIDIPLQSSGCQIYMKITLNPLKPDDQSGSAVVDVKLVDKSGVPLAGKEIVMTASWGTFLCRSRQDTTGTDSLNTHSCFITDQAGKASINLTNLPINSPVKVKATCECGDYTVSAAGSLSIKQVKQKIKRKEYQ